MSSLSSSVPDISFTSAGVAIPPEGDVLAGVQIDINYAFGGGVNPALETPQGQIASSTTAAIADKNAAILYVSNQIDPQYASGRWQDGIARIYFLDRKGATPTAVSATMIGAVDTVVPAATLAQDTNGNTYVLLGDTKILPGGQVTGSWANVVNGPIPCPAGTLTVVYQSVPGWDAITNPTDGTLGQNEETRSEFETRRQNSVAINGRGTCPSIYANVFNVENVLDCYVIDNPKGYVVNKGATNYPMLPHSLYVAVIGGADQDILNAIWGKKDVGCDYNGNVTGIVTDTSGYNYPLPTYDVSFERPTAVPVSFAIQIVNNPALPANLSDLVKAAVIARFNGTDGTNRERIGATILASRYYSAIGAVDANLVLLGVLVGAGSATATNLPIGIDQAPTLDVSNITVVYV